MRSRRGSSCRHDGSPMLYVCRQRAAPRDGSHATAFGSDFHIGTTRGAAKMQRTKAKARGMYRMDARAVVLCLPHRVDRRRAYASGSPAPSRGTQPLFTAQQRGPPSLLCPARDHAQRCHRALPAGLPACGLPSCICTCQAPIPSLAPASATATGPPCPRARALSRTHTHQYLHRHRHGGIGSWQVTESAQRRQQ